MMGYLDLALASHAKLKTPCNEGHEVLPPSTSHPISLLPNSLNYEINELNEVSPRPEAYRLVSNSSALAVLAGAVSAANQVALDTETTGLNPRSDRVRLLALAVEGQPVHLVDCFAVDPAPLRKVLAVKPIIGHNLAFDLSFLARLGLTPQGPIHDTMILSQLLHAGTPAPKGFYTLAACLDRELKTALDKCEQASDWSRATLSEAQLAYAAN